MSEDKSRSKMEQIFHRDNFIKFFFLIVIGFFSMFFLNETYHVLTFFIYLGVVIFLLFGFYFLDKDFFSFILYSLVSISTFISLEISFNFGYYFNFLVAMFIALVVSYYYCNKKTNECYAILLLYSFVLIWAILGFNVLDRTDWILENAINVPFIIILLLVSRWFRFSKLSYSLFYLFMFMNVVGSHYTYALVPFGDWLSMFFNLSRNHYDRIIHFLFGFLLAYPLREVYVRVGNYKGIWSIIAPVSMVFGLSAVYEIIEWLIAIIFGGDLGIAYLGSQGDVWDAQKDMLLAGIGSMISMLIVFFVLIAKKGKMYISELSASLKVKEKTELGEVALENIEKEVAVKSEKKIEKKRKK